MAEQESSFRDFGILPIGLKPPADRVRCFLSTGRIAGQWIGTVLVASVGVVLAVVFLIFLPAPLSLLGAMAAGGAFAAFVHLATLESAEQNPLVALPAFKAFQKDHKARCIEPPVFTELLAVESY